MADAPVQATAEITVAAPQSRIWSLLTGVKDWSKWQTDIARTSITGNPAVGIPFQWSTGRIKVHSTIRLIDPERTFCWTGRVAYFHAIHCWSLSPLPDGRTLVTTRESMDGWLISRLYSSRELLESDQRWLLHLKQAAESDQALNGAAPQLRACSAATWQNPARRLPQAAWVAEASR